MKTYQATLAAAGATLALVIANPAEAQWSAWSWSDDFTDEKGGYIFGTTPKMYNGAYVRIVCKTGSDWSSVMLILDDKQINFDEISNAKFRVDKNEVLSFPINRLDTGSYYSDDHFIIKKAIKEMKNGEDLSFKIGNNKTIRADLKIPLGYDKSEGSIKRAKEWSFSYNLNKAINEYCPYLKEIDE